MSKLRAIAVSSGVALLAAALSFGAAWAQDEPQVRPGKPTTHYTPAGLCVLADTSD